MLAHVGSKPTGATSGHPQGVAQTKSCMGRYHLRMNKELVERQTPGVLLPSVRGSFAAACANVTARRKTGARNIRLYRTRNAGTKQAFIILLE